MHANWFQSKMMDAQCALFWTACTYRCRTCEMPMSTMLTRCPENIFFRFFWIKLRNFRTMREFSYIVRKFRGFIPKIQQKIFSVVNLNWVQNSRSKWDSTHTNISCDTRQIGQEEHKTSIRIVWNQKCVYTNESSILTKSDIGYGN